MPYNPAGKTADQIAAEIRGAETLIKELQRLVAIPVGNTAPGTRTIVTQRTHNDWATSLADLTRRLPDMRNALTAARLNERGL